MKLTRSTVNYATSLAAELMKKKDATERLQKRIKERLDAKNETPQMIDLTEDGNSPVESTPYSEKKSTPVSSANDTTDGMNNLQSSNTPVENTPKIVPKKEERISTPRYLYYLYRYYMLFILKYLIIQYNLSQQSSANRNELQ